MLKSMLVSKQRARQQGDMILNKEEGVSMTCDQSNLVLRIPDGDTAIKVENLFREAACEGTGIAMDEINHHGLLNRK